MKLNNIRTIIATFALLAGITQAWAGVERPTTLCVENTKGEVMTFPLSENPKMTFVGTYVVIKTSEPKLLKFKELTRAYFLEEDPDAVTDAAATPGETVSPGADVIGFSHFAPLTRVLIYSASGSIVKAAQTDVDGRLRLSVSDLPHGVYVIQAGHSSVKMSK